MHKEDLISSIILICLSLGILIYAIPNHISLGMGFGLSPKGLPKVMAAGILALAVVQAASALFSIRKSKRTDAQNPSKAMDKSHWPFLGLLSVILIASLVTMNFIGFIVGGFLFMLMFQLLVGQRNWVILALIAIFTPILLKAAFWYGMGVLLPQGTLF